ncbi:Valine--pyruvate aminotransferase [Fusarium equiseti]|uniref:Valine--pyruvate aminotransferase n=1 Tax=Fusarium equiseti TaxID=61235 RepID=A0ABQ8QWA9_FUSEQ|nr:Valine--pyruvate aminotransferase [Fusarium equiseti]
MTTKPTHASEVPPNPHSEKHQINLIRGWPNPGLLPVDLLSAAAHRNLSDPDIYVPALQYGPDPGYQPLREALASWLSEHYRVERDPNRICISGGASQNLACILQSFTDPHVTQTVWCVSPSYHLVFQVFQDNGFNGRLRATPEDDEGVDIEALETKLADFEKNAPETKPPLSDAGKYCKHYRHIIYAVPTCSNPSGKTMSLRRREALVRLARKYDALIICDDVYDFLQWRIDSDPNQVSARLSANEHPEMLLPRLCDIDLAMGQAENDPQGFGHAVSNGSFSKLAGPGMRTGWLEGSTAFAYGLSQTGATKSGGSPSQFCASIMADLVQSGALQERLATTLRPQLQQRHRIMMEAIHKHLGPIGVGIRDAGLPDGTVYGGYFVWLTLEQGISAKTVSQAAMTEENLVVGNGTMFQVPGDEETVDLDNAVRLTFAYVSKEDLTEGVERLASVLRRIKDNPTKYKMFASMTVDSDIIDANK